MKTLITRSTRRRWTICFTAFTLTLFAFGASLASCKEKEPVPTEEDTPSLTIEERYRLLELDNESLETSLTLTARRAWTATVAEGGSWLTVRPDSGVGGRVTVNFYAATSNQAKEPRTALVHFKAGNQTIEVRITQPESKVVILSESQVPDIEKYYKPQEFGNMNMLRSDAKWSWVRSKQSEHFVVFWEEGFGEDPHSAQVPASMRVDIDDLLRKAEQFYHTNVEVLGMAQPGASNLDKYKLQIYLLYQAEWLATGAGYDNVIGALWVNPSTCQPVGSTIAHEIGHSFQYQVYCDKIAHGAPNDFRHGFRYGYPGSNGGCGYWEQCAQWQAHRDYPYEQFTSHDFNVWVSNCHRHFEHEWMRYASYWLQSYWVQLRGIEAYSRIWHESVYPMDAIMTYTQLYHGGDYAATREELAHYALRMATYDIDGVREYNTTGAQQRYKTQLLKDAEGYYRPVYAQCPGATGFNVIPLNVPSGGGAISVDFEGLPLGAPLLEDDPGEIVDGDGKLTGTTRHYNTEGKANQMGWRYGFVALQSDGTRVYSEMGREALAQLSFTVPAACTELYMVVQGSPAQYITCPWDEKGENDAQFPYRIKFHGTALLGNFDIDETAEVSSIVVKQTLSCNAAAAEYLQGTLNLATFDVCQAFVLTAEVMAAKILPVGQQPTEGKIVLANRETNGTLVYAGKANNGFWLDKDGNNGAWGNDGYCYFEINGTQLDYGAYPGHITQGETYVIRPTLVYRKDGKQFTATFELTLQF